MVVVQHGGTAITSNNSQQNTEWPPKKKTDSQCGPNLTKFTDIMRVTFYRSKLITKYPDLVECFFLLAAIFLNNGQITIMTLFYMVQVYNNECLKWLVSKAAQIILCFCYAHKLTPRHEKHTYIYIYIYIYIYTYSKGYISCAHPFFKHIVHTHKRAQ